MNPLGRFLQSLAGSTGSGELSPEAELIYRERLREQRHETSEVFFWLMPAQWLFALGLAWLVSPRAWAGLSSSVHPHLWAALAGGALLASAPMLLARSRPDAALTRHIVAVAQMLFSALLIHLTGGRIETHFHVFGSLAILAFYLDRSVLLTAALVVVADHLLRGLFLPQSVYGVAAAGWWRSLEHGGWVVFEILFLSHFTRRTVTRTLRLAAQAAAAEQAVVAASRRAGMAEVAVGVLHNVGNVLNSVNVCAGIISDRVRASRVGDLRAIIALVRAQNGGLADFLTTDPQGRLVPELLGRLADGLRAEYATLAAESDTLVSHVGHIRDIVAMQQNHATVSGLSEKLAVSELVEDALKLQASALTRHGIEVVREFDDVPPVVVDRHKTLQILVNLIRNAGQAMADNGGRGKRLTLGIGRSEHGHVRITVRDVGIGIPAENLARIFGHGFTTRKDGHGFGLHSSALAAREMGGLLTTASDGPGTGAVFTLELPLADEQPAAETAAPAPPAAPRSPLSHPATL